MFGEDGDASRFVQRFWVAFTPLFSYLWADIGLQPYARSWSRCRKERDRKTNLYGLSPSPEVHPG